MGVASDENFELDDFDQDDLQYVGVVVVDYVCYYDLPSYVGVVFGYYVVLGYYVLTRCDFHFRCYSFALQSVFLSNHGLPVDFSLVTRKQRKYRWVLALYEVNLSS